MMLSWHWMPSKNAQPQKKADPTFDASGLAGHDGREISDDIMDVFVSHK